MAKKKTKRKKPQFRQENKITYNTAKPNRQARRLGIVAVEPPKQEEPKRVSKEAVLSQKVQQAQEQQKKITPPGMTYGEYLEYLKENAVSLFDIGEGKMSFLASKYKEEQPMKVYNFSKTKSKKN